MLLLALASDAQLGPGGLPARWAVSFQPGEKRPDGNRRLVASPKQAW
jgi:hypothetical protein